MPVPHATGNPLHLFMLVSLVLFTEWVACLRSYATVHADSEFVHDLSIVSVDPSYAYLGKVGSLPVSQSFSLHADV